MAHQRPDCGNNCTMMHVRKQEIIKTTNPCCYSELCGAGKRDLWARDLCGKSPKCKATKIRATVWVLTGTKRVHAHGRGRHCNTGSSLKQTPPLWRLCVAWRMWEWDVFKLALPAQASHGCITFLSPRSKKKRANLFLPGARQLLPAHFNPVHFFSK